MKKEFVPYTEDLELKQLGFDEPCFGYYNMVNHSGKFQFDTRIWENSDDYIDAPLYQQAFRWFREKYQLDSSIALVANGYGFYIHKNRNYTNKGESYGMYITYEEAELACLKKLIEIVNTEIIWHKRR
jgi:hypothetical protein